MKKIFFSWILAMAFLLPFPTNALVVNFVSDIHAGTEKSCTEYRCITKWKESFQRFLDETSGLIITVGDNTDRQEKAMKTELRAMTAGREVYWANGNHDKKNYVGGSNHYVFNKEGWRIIILASSAARSKSERKWLEKNLKGYADKKVMVVEHHPIFRQQTNKVLSGHKKIKKIYEKYKVDYVFSGHWHSDRYTRTINGVTYKAVKGLTYATFGNDSNYLTLDLN